MPGGRKQAMFGRSVMAIALAALLLAGTAFSAQAFSQSEEYIGTVALFAGNFTPKYWLPCDGRLLSIAEYSTLFALLGCKYGGDCRTTFALPDLRGRVPIGQGSGAGLSPRQLGQKGGSETVTAAGSGGGLHSGSSGDQAIKMDNMPPFAALQYIICWRGLWPPRP